LRLKTRIKSQAINTRDSADRIITDMVEELTDEEMNILLKKDSVKKVIKRERENLKDMQIDPFTDIPSILHKDIRGEQFL
jgi:hypothetical protein